VAVGGSTAVEDTALEGGSTEEGSTEEGSTEEGSTEGALEGAVSAFVIAVSVGAVSAFVIVVFGTLMGASSALDILTSTRFIIPITTRIRSTGLIRDTKCVRASRLHAESGRMKMAVGFC
jgi:hypothetical protein